MKYTAFIKKNIIFNNLIQNDKIQIIYDKIKFKYNTLKYKLW